MKVILQNQSCLLSLLSPRKEGASPRRGGVDQELEGGEPTCVCFNLKLNLQKRNHN